jgi:hypothetical protein
MKGNPLTRIGLLLLIGAVLTFLWQHSRKQTSAKSGDVPVNEVIYSPVSQPIKPVKSTSRTFPNQHAGEMVSDTPSTREVADFACQFDLNPSETLLREGLVQYPNDSTLLLRGALHFSASDFGIECARRLQTLNPESALGYDLEALGLIASGKLNSETLGRLIAAASSRANSNLSKLCISKSSYEKLQGALPLEKDIFLKQLSTLPSKFNNLLDEAESNLRKSSDPILISTIAEWADQMMQDSSNSLVSQLLLTKNLVAAFSRLPQDTVFSDGQTIAERLNELEASRTQFHHMVPEANKRYAEMNSEQRKAYLEIVFSQGELAAYGALIDGQITNQPPLR